MGAPTEEPTDEPTDEPTPSPTKEPTDEPTPSPTEEPTDKPSPLPTPSPTTTEEPTDSPTPSPTEEPTDEPTPSPTPEPTNEPTPSPTEEQTWPTPRPTLKSAMKWEMIHPNYEGSDGELLWHVYYGDYSNDERFDAFRAEEKWDAQEIKPVIQSDIKFKRYARDELYNAESQSVPSSDKDRSSSSSHGWIIILMSIVLIAGVAYWYVNNAKNTRETSRLLDERYVSYQRYY